MNDEMMDYSDDAAADRRLDEIALEIQTIRKQTENTVLVAACETGKRLIEAKNYLRHGCFGAWLKDKIDYSERQAQNLMGLYETYALHGDPQALADLSITKAVMLMAAPADVRAAMIESGEADDLSTRDLQKRLQELRAEADKAQVRIEQLEALRAEDAEALAKAAEANEAAKKADDAIKAANDKAATESARLQKQLEASEARVRAVEAEMQAKVIAAETKASSEAVVPAEVRDELTRLREIARKAPNELVIVVRSRYDRIISEFKSIKEELDILEDDDPTEAGRYRTAFARGLISMADKLG